MTIGEKINELRKERNLTLAELAKRSGLTAITLTNWKRGKTKPQLVALKRVADVLKCDFEELKSYL